MIRRIIKIDEDKCNGCGACAAACHEGAIEMVDGIAKLTRDDYCDGLGDCLPQCPTGAITFEEREAPAYNEAAVAAAKKERSKSQDRVSQGRDSRLGQWPCQIKLAPVSAPYFKGAKLLIAADCTAYAYACIHDDYMDGSITLIGCPKLDGVDYSEKLTAILQNNDIKTITLLRMEVPCCGGMELAIRKALAGSKKNIPWKVVTISIEGKILKDEEKDYV